MRQLTPYRRSLLSDSFFKDFDDIFEQFFTNHPSQMTDALKFSPRLDLQEFDDHYLASFDLPGMDQENISIEVKDNHLIVTGERVNEVEHKDDKKFRHFERSFGKFQRMFSLPDSVDSESIEAHYEKGVLEILIPKSEKKENKKVEVKSGQGGLLKRLLNKTNH